MDPCELKASLEYIESSRTAELQRERPCLNRKKENKQTKENALSGHFVSGIASFRGERLWCNLSLSGIITEKDYSHFAGKEKG